MAVGHSDDVDPSVAIRIAIDECREALGDRTPSAALMFSTADAFDRSLIDAVRAAFPGIDVVGSTSAAEISSVHGYQEDSVSLGIFASDRVEIGTGLGSRLGEDVDAACARAVGEALAHVTSQPKVCIALHESFVIDPALVTPALARALPEGVAILGGTSARSDFTVMTPTYQFRNETVVDDGLVIMLFCGAVAFSTAVGMGFRTIGPQGTVTRAEATSLEEIDGRPATDFLRRYVDQTGPAAYANPLAVFDAGADGHYLRVIPPSGSGSGSFRTAGGIPVGARVQLTTADTDEVLAGTKGALERALSEFPSDARPGVALIFSCAVRKFFLGSRTRVEAELARSALGDLPVMGLYCYGEIGPIEGTGGSRFLNETFVTLLLGG